jgi:hypothetical protein
MKLQISNLGFVLINVFSIGKIRKAEGKKKSRKGILILAKKSHSKRMVGYFAFLVALRLIAVKPTVKINVMAK